MKRTLAILLAASLVLGLCACGSSSSSSTDTTSAETTAAQAESAGETTSSDTSSTGETKNSVVVQNSADPGDLPPFNNMQAATNRIKVNNIYESLYMIGYDNELTPMLATEYEWQDNTHLAVTLREGVLFHDGTEMTAEDVVYSYQQCAQSTAYTKYTANVDVDNIEVVDDYHIVLPLTSEDYSAIYDVLCVFIVPENAMEDYDMANNPIGTGPYMLTDWVSGSTITLSAFEDYWGGENAGIDTITFRVITESAQRVIELETGGVDYVYDLAGSDAERLEEEDGYTVEEIATNKNSVLFFNTTETSVLSSKELRQAICYAIDAEAICHAVYNDLSVPSYTYFPAAFAEFDESWFDGYLYPVDTEKAKELVEASGVTDLNLTVIVDEDSTRQAIAQIVQAELMEIGITLTIENYETATYSSMLGDLSGTWDMFFGNINVPSGDALSGADAQLDNTDINRSGYQNDELQSLIMEGLQTYEAEDRIPIIQQIVEIYNENVPFYTIADLTDVQAHVSNLKGYQTWSSSQVRWFDMYFE
ncbi:MAG: ABC transporter substrate-binding protein [Lachnospiraceae bacterium]|nr:ABC transporter substrate-binding protein [Lachnospiraceae bacterium]